MQRSVVRLSVCPTLRPPHAAAAGLLLSARRTGDIDRLLPCPALSSSGAAARRSVANEDSATLTSEHRRVYLVIRSFVIETSSHFVDYLGIILLPEPGRSGCAKESTLTASPDTQGRTRP